MRRLLAVLLLAACGSTSEPVAVVGDAAPDAKGAPDAPNGNDAATETLQETAGGDSDTGGEPGLTDAGPVDVTASDGGAGLDDTSSPAAECPDDLTFFATKVRAPIFVLKCAGCHNPAGLASNTDFVLAGPGDAAPIEADFATVSSLVSKTLQGVPVLLLKPTGLHPAGHTGGALVAPGSPEHAALTELVQRVVGDAPCDLAPCTVRPGPPLLRRLTRAEIDATLTSLLGAPSSHATGFTAENVVHGFDNNAAALVVNPLFADQLREAAEAVAKEAAASPALVSCAPESAGCDKSFVSTFGQRAFRRPLTAAETARYVELFHLAADVDGFVAGVEITVAAMLQSPHFLYRRELGTSGAGGYTLDAWEVASELSYLLWGTMPDAPLFERAADGTLLTPAVLHAEVDRLLDDPRAQPAAWRFAEQWLGLRLLPVLPKDAATYPDLTPALRADMLAEARAFVSAVLLGDAPVEALFTQTTRAMSPALAAFYGLPAGTSDVAGTPYPGGVLGLGSVLLVHAFPAGSSPIHRGKLVRERLLCQELSPPPPGLVAQLPAVTPDTTGRERFAEHMSVQPCLDCHRLMDPIGFGLEHFDGVGRFRPTESGKAIDASGEILGSPSSDGVFDGLGELSAKLEGSEDVRRCFARQVLRFAFGLEPGAHLACLEDAIVADWAAAGGSYRALIHALVDSPHFTRREDEPEPPDLPVIPPQDVIGDGDVVSPTEDVATSAPLEHEVTIDSQWEGGHCAQVTVHNPGSSGVTWSLLLPIAGSVTQVWNANAAPMGESVTFSGVAWNATLAPGGSTKFGYCASATAPSGGGLPAEDLTVDVVVDSQWETGFCHSVTVTNAGEETGSWTIELELPGVIQNLWNAQATLLSGSTYRFSGAAWNASLDPGASATFGLCGSSGGPN